MRIALVVPGGVDPGGERRVIPCLLWLIRRLATLHDVEIFALSQPGAPPRYSLLGATVHHIGRPRTALRAVHALWRAHRRAPFDVLHGFWASPAGALAAVAGRLLRVPAIVHAFGGEFVGIPDIDYGDQRSAGGRRRVRMAMRAAHAVTTQSQPMVEAAARLGYDIGRLPMGVDLTAWPVLPPRPRPHDRPARLVLVASLSRVKDPLTMIRAAARIAADGTRFTLDIVGLDLLGGTVLDEAVACGIGERIRLHGELVQERVRAIVSEADLMVVPSRHEAGPIVILEAAASGVPTVGTAVGTIREWSPDAAVAVPAREPEALAAAVRALLEDDARRLRTAALAQRRAIAEDADSTAQRVSRLYSRLARR